VQHVMRGDVPSNLLDMRLVTLDMSALMARDEVEVEGAKMRSRPGARRENRCQIACLSGERFSL
jgi:hypothetical protein